MGPNPLPEQALAFYRSPAHFPALRNPERPLRGDAGPLLRLAGGADPASLGLPRDLASAEEWRAAAQFFIEQALLAPGANYYRIHGLPRDAGDEEIKEHHRLLMRLVHPDREHSEEAWQTAAAARINQAYATLRDSARRAEYDRALAEAEKETRSAAAPDPLFRPPPRRSRAQIGVRRQGDTPIRRFLWRHLPQVSLVATLLLAMIWVGWVWLDNKPSAALGSDDGGTIVALADRPAINSVPSPPTQGRGQGEGAASPARRTAITTPTPTRSQSRTASRPTTDTPPARQERARAKGEQAATARRAATSSIEETKTATIAGASRATAEQATEKLPTSALQAAAPRPDSAITAPHPTTAGANLPSPSTGGRGQGEGVAGTSPHPATAPANSPSLSTGGRGLGEGGNATAITSATHPSQAEWTKPAPDETRTAQEPAVTTGSTPHPATAAATATTPPQQTQPPRPRVLDLNAVVSQFSERYQSGDLERFMALFDADARNETGNRAKIRKDYEQLFASTVKRHVVVYDMIWSPKGAAWSGEGRFQVTVQRRNEDFQRVYNGILRLDLVALGDRPLIRGLFHQVLQDSD